MEATAEGLVSLKLDFTCHRLNMKTCARRVLNFPAGAQTRCLSISCENTPLKRSQKRVLKVVAAKGTGTTPSVKGFLVSLFLKGIKTTPHVPLVFGPNYEGIQLLAVSPVRNR